MKTNNRNKKGSTLFQTGLIVALSLSLVAFEWRYETTPIKIVDERTFDGEIEFIPITKTEEAKPEAQKIKITKTFNPDILKEVPNDVKIDEPKEEDSVAVKVPDFTPVVDDRDKDDEPVHFMAVEKMPMYDDCNDEGVAFTESCTLKKMYAHLGKTLKYPKMSKEAKIEGTVHVEFVVNKHGKVVNVNALGGPNQELKDAAVTAISSMPKMNPGTQRGKNVNVKFLLPVAFKLKK